MAVRHKRITIVLKKVAKSELTFSIPIFAKIAVSAAKIADSNAQNCQEEIVSFIGLPFEIKNAKTPSFQASSTA